MLAVLNRIVASKMSQKLEKVIKRCEIRLKLMLVFRKN